jgi:peptidylprolyl isomerase
MKIKSFFILMILTLTIAGCSNGAHQDTKQGEDTMANSIAVFDTSLGTFKIELFEGKSPITTGNFKTLAEQGFYDGTRIHRVIANFMVQGGDPLSKDSQQKARWGTGGPGYAIEDELIPGLSNVRGTIAMANHGPNTGGSQFFINVVDNTFLDWDKPPAQSKHPVFGAVIEGIDVVDAIASVETGANDLPAEDVIIRTVTIQ